MKKLLLSAALCGLILPAVAHNHEKGAKDQSGHAACKMPKGDCCAKVSAKSAVNKYIAKNATAAKPGEKVAQFTVSKMTCEGCSGALVSGLSKEKGVREAKVDFKTKRATVRYDAKTTDPKKLEAAFGRKGFPAKLLKS